MEDRLGDVIFYFPELFLVHNVAVTQRSLTLGVNLMLVVTLGVKLTLVVTLGVKFTLGACFLIVQIFCDN